MPRTRTVPIRYVGKKPTYTDHLYGTKASWAFGDAVDIDVTAARKFVQHPEFEDAREDTSVPLKQLSLEVEGEESTERTEEELDHEPPLVNLDNMTKAQIIEYAHRQFGVELDGKATKAQLTDTVRLQMGRRNS